MWNNPPLLGAIAAIVVGILGLVGTRWVAGVAARTQRHEQELRRYEGPYNTISKDYERVVAERDAARAEADEYRLKFAKAHTELTGALATVAEKDRQIAMRDRQIEDWIKSKEAG